MNAHTSAAVIDPPVVSREWMRDAECRKYDPELFYPEEGSGEAGRREAMQICGRCPVRRDCLIYAFEIDDRFGILGQTTKAQRSTIRNRMRRHREAGN